MTLENPATDQQNNGINRAFTTGHYGGGVRKIKRKTNKRKTNKRKTNKRKINKRKTKRKINKRK